MGKGMSLLFNMLSRFVTEKAMVTMGLLIVSSLRTSDDKITLWG